MKKIIFAVFGLLCLSLSYADNKQFDTMVVFGDSLSDNGNLYRVLWNTLPASPPYYLGHFSNGTIWAEQLHDRYFSKDNAESFQNYAVGGAGAVLAYKQYFPYTLAMELDNYLYWHTHGKKETTLYTIWIGGNNYLHGPTNVESITDSVVYGIGSGIERLIKAGGTKFLIPNLPDLGRTPYATEQNSQELLSRLVNVHNHKLASKVDELRTKYPQVTLVYFDVYTYFNQALDQATDLGFSNTDEPCYLGGYLGLLARQPDDKKLHAYVDHLSPHFASTHWEQIKQNPQLKEAASASYLYSLLPNADELYCEGYAFWDRIHPTTKAHALIAEQARQVLDEAGLYSFTSEVSATNHIEYNQDIIR